MKNTCPKCDTAYNVSAAVVGRKFTCKNCGTPVVVTAAGLDYQNPPAPEPPPAAAASPAVAFDFDAPGAEEVERRPAKAAKIKPAKPAKRPAEEPAPAEEDEDLNAPPRRRAQKGGGGGSNAVKDFLLFREFIAPIFVKVIFLLAVLGIIGFGMLTAALGVLDGKPASILGGIAALVIGVPFWLLMARVYCEIILLGFSLYDRLGEIKALLEKQPPPPAP